MVRMVRIAGVAALILSGLVVASVFGPVQLLRSRSPNDAGIQEFLKSPSAVERFNSQHGAAPDTQDKTPPLVRHAEGLAAILTPRVETSGPPRQPDNEARISRTPPPSVSRFALVGVSYCPSDPQSCFAYIRMPDNTCEWVRPGGQVGHIIVKQVNANSIICLEGQRTSEMMVETPMNTASILETGAASSPISSGVPVPAPTGPAGLRPEMLDHSNAAASAAARLQLNEQERKNMDELIGRMKQELGKNPAAGKTDSNVTPANRTAEMGRLISEIQSSRVSEEEARKLETLGEQLNGGVEKRAQEKREELLRRLNQRRPSQPQ